MEITSNYEQIMADLKIPIIRGFCNSKLVKIQKERKLIIKMKKIMTSQNDRAMDNTPIQSICFFGVFQNVNIKPLSHKSEKIGGFPL